MHSVIIIIIIIIIARASYPYDLYLYFVVPTRVLPGPAFGRLRQTRRVGGAESKHLELRLLRLLLLLLLREHPASQVALLWIS